MDGNRGFEELWFQVSHQASFLPACGLIHLPRGLLYLRQKPLVLPFSGRRLQSHGMACGDCAPAGQSRGVMAPPHRFQRQAGMSLLIISRILFLEIDKISFRKYLFLVEIEREFALGNCSLEVRAQSRLFYCWRRRSSPRCPSRPVAHRIRRVRPVHLPRNGRYDGSAPDRRVPDSSPGWRNASLRPGWRAVPPPWRGRPRS